MNPYKTNERKDRGRLGKHLYLGDDCIVFENFTASIGDLMFAN